MSVILDFFRLTLRGWIYLIDVVVSVFFIFVLFGIISENKRKKQYMNIPVNTEVDEGLVLELGDKKKTKSLKQQSDDMFLVAKQNNNNEISNNIFESNQNASEVNPLINTDGVPSISQTLSNNTSNPEVTEEVPSILDLDLIQKQQEQVK